MNHPPPRRDRILLVTAMCLGTMLSMFTSTLVNVMVPAIGAEFDVPAISLGWVSTAFTLTFGAFLLLGGALGASLGRRPMFLMGIIIFSLATVLCGIAPGLGVLLIARGLQGVGIAIVMPQTLAVLSTEFSEPRARARIVGLWAGIASLGLSAGPMIGGLIVTVSSWRVGFAFSALLAVVAFFIGWQALPTSRHGRQEGADTRIDWFGAVLGTFGLAGLTGALLEFPHSGVSAIVVGSAVLAALSLTGFVLWQHRRGTRGLPPLMPLSLWRSRRLIASAVAGVAYFFMFFGILYFYSIEFQDIRSFSAFSTGMLFLPMMLMTALFGPIAGRLAGRLGTPRFCAPGSSSVLWHLFCSQSQIPPHRSGTSNGDSRWSASPRV